MSMLLRLCFSLVLLAPALVRAATLENPRNGSFYSGIGVISGWKCTADGPLTVRFNDGAPIPLAYGNERGDVRNAGACRSAQVGFVSIMNWAELGDGTHTAVVYDNGVEFARSTFTVATTGEPYVTGAEGECRVPDFPAPGETMAFAWNQSTQHLELVTAADRDGNAAPGVPRNVRVAEVGEEFIVVVWDPPAGGGAVSYNVYLRNPNEPEDLLGNVTTSGTEVSGTVVPGECYRVTAVNAAGVEGKKSSEVCVQTQQPPDGGGGRGGPAALENPANGSFYSGIGIISGWKCTANGQLTVRFNDGDPIPLAYGNERGDVRNAGACRSTQVGFVSIMNWAELGDGTHTAVVYDNGVEFARSTFTVATTGEPFVTGAEGECRVPDFPAPGETMPFAWNEATQHLEMVGDSGGGEGDDDEDGGNVCTRTPVIRDIIVGTLNRSSCDGITAGDLARVTQIIVPGPSARDPAGSWKTGDFAGLSALTHLQLWNYQLPPGVFDGLSALTRLELYTGARFGQQITLPPGVFNGLSALTHLDLRLDLTTLPPGVFNGLSALTHLDLRANQLPPGVFDGLSALTWLELTGSQLTTLPPGVFDGLSALRYLGLWNNQLTTLPSDVFNGLSALTSLALQRNRLTTLPSDVFNGLSALTWLDLASNQLTTLPSDVFNGLSALAHLGLRANQLTALPPDVFNGLSALTYLDLHNNQLTTLPPGVFADLPPDARIELRRNPGYPFPTDGRGNGNGGGTVDCTNAWTGPTGDFQVTSQCLYACAAEQAGDIQARDAACAILRQWEQHFPGTVLRYCPVCQ